MKLSLAPLPTVRHARRSGPLGEGQSNELDVGTNDAEGERLVTLESQQRLGVLFQRCHQRLYRLARRLAGDPEAANDLLQETFLRAAKHQRRLPTVLPQAEAWLVRTLVNLCRDRNRHRAVWQRIWSHLEGATPRSVDWEDAAVARQAVGTALRQLPPRRRAVVVLCDLEGLASREAAALLGMHEVTLRWHLSAARKQLATILLADRSEPRETP